MCSSDLEMRKMMGNSMAPAPPSGPTAAERQAKQASTEMTAVIARQKELGLLLQRLGEIDAEFSKKSQDIPAAPGGHKQIGDDFVAKLAKVPMVKAGELGEIHDPAQEAQLIRERVTRDRERATAELQQQAALFNQRKARYKEVAKDYATWLRGMGGVGSQTAQLVDDAGVQMAVQMEEELIHVAENLGKYSSDATLNAAAWEQNYQVRMSENARASAPAARTESANKSDATNKGEDSSKGEPPAKEPSKRESIMKRMPGLIRR